MCRRNTKYLVQILSNMRRSNSISWLSGGAEANIGYTRSAAAVTFNKQTKKNNLNKHADIYILILKVF